MFELLITHGSYLGIIALLAITGFGLPIPEEVPVAMAGVLSAKGVLHPVLALASCLIGALVGDTVLYAIGYHFGHGLLKDHPKLAHLLKADREVKFEQMIQRHGLKVLLLARFMVGVRSPVYLSAGVLRIPFRRFFLTDLLCATVVVGLVFSVAYFFGEPILAWLRGAQMGLSLAVLLCVTVLGSWIYWRFLRQRRAMAAQLAIENANRGRRPVGRTREESTAA